jgi:peptide deformylase
MNVWKSVKIMRIIEKTENMSPITFKVIPNEQTPELRLVQDEFIAEYIETHRETLLAFLEYAKTRDDAVGLAANQVAIYGDNSEDGIRLALRAFALRDVVTREWSLVIDPVITEYLGIREMKAEGCLTWKHMVIVAERSRRVVVSYYDIDGRFHEGEEYRGFAAQIWQHEVNHLNGVKEDVRIYFKEPEPITAERNELCPCGSGKKYKKCCLI